MKEKKGTTIRKASGETELFDISKLKRSLQNAGADQDVIGEIAGEIESGLQDGDTTKIIYKRAFALLKRKNRNSALRYKLKSALYKFGPTGYPFERFVGEVFRQLGFDIEVGQVIDGRCITHEVDVIATKDHVQNLIECKFSQAQGSRIGIQVPLYMRSRVQDIIEKRSEIPRYEDMEFMGWIVTNNRFSTDSIDYATCSGLNLMSWDFPPGNSLKELVLKHNVFPVTILSHLNAMETENLIEQGIVTCAQLLDNSEALQTLEADNKNFRNLMRELKGLVEYK